MKKIIICITIFIFLGIFYISSPPIYKSIDNDNALISAKASLSKNQSLIVFDSKNPFNFYDIFYRIDKINNQKVFGILTKPDTVGYFPIVFGIAGSGGWSEHHYAYLERYLNMGFAVFSLHSFKSRNVKSTVGEQLSVTIPMVIYDAFMALNQITNDKNINVNRAGILGWSLGGGVALFTAWNPIQKVISPNAKFAAHLPLYPPCMIIPDLMEFNEVPIHILAGELDDWVPAKACEEFVSLASKSGNRMDITIYPEAQHSFDRFTDIKFNPNAYSFTNCRMELKNSGIVTTTNGFPLMSPIMQKIGLYFCAERGIHSGGNNNARVKSMEFAKIFMKNNLMY